MIESKSDVIEQARQLRLKMFPNVPLSKERSNAITNKLAEETGEVIGAINSYFGRQYRPELESGDIENVKKEIGDVLFVALGLCELWGTSIDECLYLTLQKLKNRYEASGE